MKHLPDLRRIGAWLLSLALLLSLTGCAAAETPSGPSPSGVTYEIFVASFFDHDGNGSGDLLGVVDKLDYLSALGVDALWLMPVCPSPSYHKYDVTDYCAIDPQYGTLADFDALVAQCGARGIAVYLDLVVNHTSKQHPWFTAACEALAAGEQSPYTDYYCFTQDAGASGVHPVPGAAGWYYEGAFGDHMPDLNLDSEAVRAEIDGITAFWQARGVAGFRLDAVTSYYTGATGKTAAFLRWLTETVKARDPACYLVGEAWADEATILALYASGVDSLFNFPASQDDGRLIKSALKGRGDLCASWFAAWNDKLRAASPTAMDAPFLTNHDMGRSAGMLRLDMAKEKIAAMLYLLLPGRPTVYYGEELGMTGSGRDENKRLPMVWSTAEGAVLCAPPAEADQAQRLQSGAAEQEEDPASLLNFYRAVIGLRAQLPELAHGQMAAVETGSEALSCYTVKDGASTVLLCLNATADTACEAALPADAALVGTLAGGADAAQYDPATGSASLPAGSGLALRLAE